MRNSYEQEMVAGDYWNKGADHVYASLEQQWRAESYPGFELPDDLYANKTLLLSFQSANKFEWSAYMESPRFKAATLLTLEPSFLAASVAWIEQMKKSPVNLVFVGGNNTGKTHAAYAACRFMSLHGVLRRDDDLYMPRSLMLECVDAHNTLDGWAKDQDAARNVTKYKEVPLLLIDDLGAVATSSASALSNIASIVTHRYNNEMPMVATSNLNSEELSGIYGTTMVRRVFSEGSKLHEV